MALPRLVYNFLENAQIPFVGICLTSTVAAAGCFGASAVGLLDSSVAHRFATIAVASGAGAVAVRQVLERDDNKRLVQMRRRYDELVAERRTRESLSGEVSHERQLDRVVTQPQSNAEPLDLFQGRGGRPTACVGCQHYHGRIYPVRWGEQGFESYEQLVCAMHPSGWDGESCPDWEQTPRVYRLVRLQGSGNNCLYFVRADREDYSIDQMLAEAPELDVVDADDYEIAKALMQKFNRKSLNGLPGCEYKSKLSNIDEAWQELIDSCGQFMP